MKRNAFIALLSLLTLANTTVSAPAQAYDDHHGFRSHHPVASNALLGAGIGALTGGVVSHRENRNRGIVKGALIGAGAGGAYGLLTNSGRRGHYDSRGRGGGNHRRRGYGHH